MPTNDTALMIGCVVLGRCAWRCFKCARLNYGGAYTKTQGFEEWHTRNCIGNRPITVEIFKEIARDDVELCMVVL